VIENHIAALSNPADRIGGDEPRLQSSGAQQIHLLLVHALCIAVDDVLVGAGRV